MPRTDKLSTYCTTVATAGDLTCITYHSTQIVAFDRHNVTLRTGGYDTATTRRKMNQASRQFGLGYKVYCKDFGSFVELPGGKVVPLTREVTFARHA
jgi:hypothetical protein